MARCTEKEQSITTDIFFSQVLIIVYIDKSYFIQISCNKFIMRLTERELGIKNLSK